MYVFLPIFFIFSCSFAYKFANNPKLNHMNTEADMFQRSSAKANLALKKKGNTKKYKQESRILIQFWKLENQFTYLQLFPYLTEE